MNFNFRTLPIHTTINEISKEYKLTFNALSKFFNPLTANDELSRHENVTFFMDLDTEVGT